MVDSINMYIFDKKTPPVSTTSATIRGLASNLDVHKTRIVILKTITFWLQNPLNSLPPYFYLRTSNV